MCLLRRFVVFMANGRRIFHDAAHGSYRNKSEQIEHVRQEIMGNASSDRRVLFGDRMSVCGDIVNAWKKLTMNNV